jgi:hypothetical protein
MRGLAMSSFVKLYGSIIRSTVWQQPASTKLVWVTMLILADCHGKVEASIPGLAATAGVTLDECEAALLCFSSTDRYSTSKTDEGRRIRECDGGWFIINHQHYRELRTEKQIKDAQRIATKRAGYISPGTATRATCRGVAADPDPNTEIREVTPSSRSASETPVDTVFDADEHRPPSNDVHRVFGYWRVRLDHPRSKLDARRARLIRARLTEFSADALCQAIDGCAQSDFHMGRHPKTLGQRHDGIGLIFRSAENVERFIELDDPERRTSVEAEQTWLV